MFGLIKFLITFTVLSIVAYGIMWFVTYNPVWYVEYLKDTTGRLTILGIGLIVLFISGR